MGKARRERIGLTRKVKEAVEKTKEEATNIVLDRYENAEMAGRNALIEKIMKGTGCSYEESIRACQGYTEEPEPY